ncbi:hypothetical protein IAR55_004131 [Kwoniella newhampshirensis]|uniref:Adenylate cyclase n=1 Tax=Kwoniella newhampshirensis TaxID=1651941 RepID=A0AAW0Z1A4_9TREE
MAIFRRSPSTSATTLTSPEFGQSNVVDQGNGNYPSSTTFTSSAQHVPTHFPHPHSPANFGTNSSPEKSTRSLAPLGGATHHVASDMNAEPITPSTSEALRRSSTEAKMTSDRQSSGGEQLSPASTSTRTPPHSTRKVSSPPTSPRQPASPGLPGERKKHTPRTRNGSSSARMESPEEAEKRRAKIRAMEKDKDVDFDPDLQLSPARNQNRRVSPLAKRLGEEPPFMLPHPSRNDTTSQTYPGVVIGSFASGGGNTTEALGFEGGMGWEGTMDDILDPSASRADDKKTRETAGGQAEANIAPWLMDDQPKRTSPVQASTPTPPLNEDRPPSRGAAATLREKEGQRKSSMQVLNHFASVPTLPKIRRQGTIDTMVDTGPGSRSGSRPYNSGATTASASSSSSIRDGSRQSRNGSGDSLQTLSASQQKSSRTTGESPGAENPKALPVSGLSSKQGNIGPRVGRFGSTTSQVSGGGSTSSEKKKGFLGGLLKRKTGPSISLNPLMSDFGPSESHRGSGSGSASSRISSSTSMGSFNQRSPPSNAHPTDRAASDSCGRAFRHGSQYVSEGAISPLHEISETPFHLDMNLDDMEGIVDPTKANVQPSGPVPPVRSDTAATTSSGPSESTSGSMFLQDALQETSSFATSVSQGGSTGSLGSGGTNTSNQPTGRAVISEAERQSGNPFVRSNPFQSGGSAGSLDVKSFTPPSPHTLSPKHHLPPTTQPRRPSQLRNVKTGSTDSENSEGQDANSLQPIAPAWASSTTPRQTTVFNDPFNPASTIKYQGPSREMPSPSRAAPPRLTKTDSGEASDHRSSAGTSSGLNDIVSGSVSGPVPGVASGSNSGSLAPPAAWAAPESWGVEGDDELPEESDTSEEDDPNWVAEDDDVSGMKPDNGARPSSTQVEASPSGQKRAAPPFGFKPAQNSVPKSARGSAGARPGTSGTKRGKSSSGRPSTSHRPGTGGRPGTSGSAHISTPPQWMRIYRVDGSYSLLVVPINTTTAEVISILSGANEAQPGKKITTSMRLYLRERGQDRMLLPSERPASIQHRRLVQAGFTDAEHIEDLGKDDLAILCRFIYQTPVLPIMDPEEESSYDSFEFIDVGGRDLQTIPIFLHLHAHNIIILNVSRNPMTDIPLDFIQACTTLKELRMQNMALKRVPMSIRASNSLARLDVSCNRIADLESVPLHEVETLVSLKVQNNKLISIPSYFAQMKSLKYLNISNNKFETFPTIVCEMSNLVDLDVSFNNITELPSEMSDLKSLEKLALFSNELTKFPDSFSTLANLKQLDVRRNKITDLTAVYALPNLQDLQADNNNIVTLDAQIGANVRQFSVPHNSVTRFTLAPLPNMAMVTYLLTNLDLSHGKISTLADEAFSGLINLVHLNLNFNQFTRLPPTLDRLTNLETFSCTDNMLNFIPKGFGKMQKLREINLHNNNLKGLASDLWACASLELFNASSNLLEGFEPPPEDYDEYVGSEPPRKSSIASQTSSHNDDGPPPAGLSTKKLYLGDNRLTDDMFHWVAMMPNIKVLNLSFNEIYEIPPYTIGKCDKLEALYLSGNKLTSLPSEDLEKLVNLKTLHLNGNKLQTLPSELGAIKTLQHLDVGSNVLKYNIANWPYDWNWNWNTALRYLNLSGNKRLEIKPTSAQDMSHASSFRKELSDFTALTQLRVLGLMDVTLRIPSLPDESDEKRVRTSFSDVNNMAYGISDMLGSIEHLNMFDLVVPNFRGKDNECIFGMFGRSASGMQAGKIPKHLQEIFAETLASHLEKLQEGEDASQALRRTFLWANRTTFDHFVGATARIKERKGSATSFASIDDMFRNWAPSVGSVFRTGASGAVVYLVDKTLHVGNVGDTLVVLSRKGEAELLSKKHDPTDREETARIRKAEAWVSTKGYVNDDKDIDISRAFGYWHECLAVNADPEIRTRPLQESDEFVIIGNQALWKCCSYQTAVDIARTERDDPMMAAQKLRDFAICYGAEGSVMVMVVNISDLFFGRRGQRPRGIGGSGPQATADAAVDGDGFYGAAAKRPAGRRRYEEVGDRTLNRLQQEIEPPTGQVAIVFTDIVNSTHLWETNPGMPTAIKMHHSFMRRQLRLDGGYEVKTEGDSFMVSFQSVTAALLWCFNCQIGLLSQEWPRELLDAHDGKIVYDSNGGIVARGLRVRMGVHWGAPECERDPITRRMDYYGPMVNRAARINASADGGQLMASQDVINEIGSVREYLETSDEDAVNELQGDMKREMNELRRIGLFVKDMGERKLKGLEVPEKLHLLYPKTLSGRAEISNELRAEVEVNDARKLAEEQRVIDIEKVRQLANIALRLEAICSIKADSSSPPTSPTSAHSFQRDVSTAVVRGGGSGKTTLGIPPSHLGPSIREDMSDEELTVVIESLTGRVENAMSTLYIKHLGGFGSVLAALEQATRIDQKLLVHAMALMNGAFGG